MTAMTYPRAWIAQDWLEPEWDGEGDPPEPFDGDGPLPELGSPYGHIDTGSAAVENRTWATLEEAIAWARERVSVVLVRVGYSEFRHETRRSG